MLGVGEIGLHKCTPNEVTTLLAQIDLAMQAKEQMLFHTPHLEDKYKGTRMILDMLAADRRVDHSRVCIDHCEEHTIRLAREQGYWTGMTLYPTTKATPERAVDMIEIYGTERMLVNSSADWGPSKPTAVPEFIGGDASPRASGSHDPQDRLRESLGLLPAEPEFLWTVDGGRCTVKVGWHGRFASGRRKSACMKRIA